MIRRCLVWLAIALSVAAPRAQPVARPAPILILVSFDGWRWDYLDAHPDSPTCTPSRRAACARRN